MGTSTGRGVRVLVIEDDASLNEIVCTFLTQEGFVCTPAFSGSEARLLLEGLDAGVSAEPNLTDRNASAISGNSAQSAPAAGNTASRPFNLVITDLMLPGLPGEDLVPFVRRRLGNIPVIVTSAKSAVADRVTLLRTGADDYLVKPFDLDELLARIEVQLRLRSAMVGIAQASAAGAATAADTAEPSPAGDTAGATTGNQRLSSHGPGAAHASQTAPTAQPARTPFSAAPSDTTRVAQAATAQASNPPFSPTATNPGPDSLTFGAWRLDPARRSFTVNGSPLKLTRTEFDLAAALMRQPERVFSKRDLYLAACHNPAAQADAAAGVLGASDEKTVSTHIGNLRAKLKPTGTDAYIETVWGIGFKLKDPCA